MHIVIIFCAGVSLAQSNSSEKLVSLFYDNQPLREVLEDICEQTNLLIVYQDDLVDNKYVDINSNRVSAEIALKTLLYQQNLDHKYFGENSVVVFRNKIKTNPKHAEERIEVITSPTVTNLRLLSDNNPKYPYNAASQSIEGSVTIKIFIAKDGSVYKAEISKSSGSEILDSNTLEFVYSLKYSPLKINNTPRASWILITYNYLLAKAQ